MVFLHIMIELIVNTVVSKTFYKDQTPTLAVTQYRRGPAAGKKRQADRIPRNSGRTNRSTAFSAVTSGTQRSRTMDALIMPLT